MMVAVPSVPPLNENVTVCPFGIFPLLASVAVNFTDVPDVDGFGDEVSVIVIFAGSPSESLCTNVAEWHCENYLEKANY